MARYGPPALAIPLLFAAILTSSAAGQDTRWTVAPVFRFGALTKGAKFHQSEPGGAWVSPSSAPLVGVGAELRTPLPWLAVRATAEHTIGSDLTRWDFDGYEPCGPTCSAVVTNGVGLAPASVAVISTSIVLRPDAHVGPVYPIGMAGLSVKRRASDYAPARDDLGTDLGWHVGVGLEMTVGHVQVGLEAIDHVDHSSSRRTWDGVFWSKPGRRLNDLFVALVFTIPVSPG